MRQTPSPSTVRSAAHRRGVWSEIWVAAYLWCRGYRLRARRYKTPVGEIDLIATRGRTLVFIEVKARPNLTEGLSAIAPSSYWRLAQAASLYVARHPTMNDYRQRFDLVVVLPRGRIYHLDNIDVSRS